MKYWVSPAILSVCLCTSAFAAAKGPEVGLVDNKLSINVEAVPLSRLLRLFDMATGMKSRVPAELANRNVSVKFSGLDLSDGVKKMFQGQPLDYVMIQGQGIVITAASQSGGSDLLPAYNPPPPSEQPQPFFNQDFQPPIGQPGQQQPAMIQSPFGPIPNPRAGQPVQPNAPLSAPGQQNSLYPSTSQPAGQPQQVSPPFPGSQPNTSPFGTPSPYGTQSVPTTNPTSLFGSPLSNPPGTPQRTP